MDKVNDIVKAVDSFRNDTTFLQLQARWEQDYDLWRLQPYNAGKGYYSYTTNSPRVLADKLISMLVESHLLIRVPDEAILNEEQRKVSNNVERLLYGALNINHDILASLPGKPSLRAIKAWYAVVRGGYATRPYVYKNDEGKTIPEIAIWDIYNVAYGQDSKGVVWAAHKYQISGQQARDQYDIKAGTAEVECLDFYDREKYGLIVNGKLVKKGFTQHGLGYCPVFIMFVGATPPVWQKNYQYTRKHIGESIFASNRDLYPAMNKTISDLVTLVRRGVKVPMGFWSASGDKTLEEDIFQVEKAAVVPLQTGDKLEPIMTQTMPADATPLMNWISGDEQRGGLSHVALGELGFRLSGYAINQLQSTLSTLIAPFAECLERSYTLECTELLKQYTSKAKHFPPMEVYGRTSKNQAFGFPTPMFIKPSDVDGKWRLEVSLEPVLPKDDAQRYQLAQLAREGIVPLLADETIRTDVLGVEDAMLEAEKIARQWADNLPLNKLWDAYIAYIADGNHDKAMNVLKEVQRLMGGMMPPAQGTATAERTATEQEAMGTPGAGIPARKTGLPSSVTPPEAQGGMPPGAQNAQLPLFATEVM